MQPLAGSTTDYALTLRQRVVERPLPDQPETTSRLETVVVISGDNLRAVADHVIEALRRADYKATDLSMSRRKPFYFPEEIGVRLGLVFLAVKPLTKIRRVEQISYGIRQMPSEEAYYWYSKCTAVDTAERAQKRCGSCWPPNEPLPEDEQQLLVDTRACLDVEWPCSRFFTKYPF